MVLKVYVLNIQNYFYKIKSLKEKFYAMPFMLGWFGRSPSREIAKAIGLGIPQVGKSSK